MKTTQRNSDQRPVEFRLPGLLALLLCAGFSAKASLADSLSSQGDQNLLAQQSLQQLSTGLQINSAADDAAGLQTLQQLSSGLQINSGGGNSVYNWQQVAPNVLSLSYNAPLTQANQQQQTLLQLLGGDSSSSSSLQLANQQTLVQSGVPTLSTASTLQQASLNNALPVQQSVLQLFSGNSVQSSVQTLQSASAVQSLSLANQNLQTSVTTLQSANPVQSALNLVQGNQLSQLSTGLKINTAVDPSKLVVSTENGLTIQLSQNPDGYNNTLGLNTAGLSINNTSLQALFTDPASQQILQNPLTLGDFVTVGHLTQSQALDFFQMAQSVNGNNLQSLASVNGPGAGDQFSTSIVALKNLNSPYLFLSICDQSGLDAQDYNSAVLAVNISQANVKALTRIFATPEPSFYLTLGGFLALAVWAKRRMDRLEAVKPGK
jgi:hypothetical protein